MVRDNGTVDSKEHGQVYGGSFSGLMKFCAVS